MSDSTRRFSRLSMARALPLISQIASRARAVVTPFSCSSIRRQRDGVVSKDEVAGDYNRRLFALIH